MLVFFFPDTPSQIVVGLLIAFASTCIYARHKPFVQSEDDFVSYIAAGQIFFIMLSATKRLEGKQKEKYGSDGTYEAYCSSSNPLLPRLL